MTGPPLSNQLLETVQVSRRELVALIKRGLSVKPARVMTGVGYGVTNENGAALVPLFTVPAGYQIFVTRVVVEMQGFNPGAPLVSPDGWVGLLESGAGSASGFGEAVAPGYLATVMGFSPVGYWRLGESSGTLANDETANNNDGTYTNSPTLGVPGALDYDSNTAVLFNGVDEFVTIPDSVSLDLGDDWTQAAWVKPTNYPATFGNIFMKGAGPPQWGINSAGQLQAFAGATLLMHSSVNIPVGVYSFVAATKNGAARAMYINGVDVTALDVNAATVDNATALQIGRNTGGSQFFPGVIDEAVQFTSELTAANILALFEAGAPTAAGIDVSELGGLLDFSPQPDGTDILPCILTSEGAEAGSVVFHGRTVSVIFRATRTGANRAVACRYKILLQESE